MRPIKFVVKNNSDNTIVISDLKVKIPQHGAIDLLKVPKCNIDKIYQSKDLSELLNLQQNNDFTAIIRRDVAGTGIDHYDGHSHFSDNQVNLNNPNLISLILIYPEGEVVKEDLPDTVQSKIVTNDLKEMKKKEILSKISDIKDLLLKYADEEEKENIEELEIEIGESFPKTDFDMIEL